MQKFIAVFPKGQLFFKIKKRYSCFELLDFVQCNNTGIRTKHLKCDLAGLLTLAHVITCIMLGNLN